MSYKRILTIQDISCVGQCSLTTALPIISACGHETAVLPSAVLSTHTAGFSGYTFRDLSDDMPKIKEHWQKENIKFDAIYTGYLGSEKQIDYVTDIFTTCLKDGGKIFVDPAMADNGKLYPGFDNNYANAMKRLCKVADFIIPNLTEACLLTDTEYKADYDEEYIDNIIEKLNHEYSNNIILTGISYKEKKTGIEVVENGKRSYYEHDLLPNSCHGTGDIYSSAFVGAFESEKSALDSAKIAADYTCECMKATDDGSSNHWYGAKFELCLGKLIEMLK